MSSKSVSIADEASEHDHLFHAAFAAAKTARARHVTVRPHRAITALAVTPYLLMQATLLPLLFCGLLFLGKPLLLEWWRTYILFWSSGLDLPFSLSTQLNQAGSYALTLPPTLESRWMPGQINMLVTTVLSLGGLVLSLNMKNAMFPLKYPLRILSILQLVTVAYFWWIPSSFPYSVGRHSEELMIIGYVVILAAPVMLGMGYYILNQALAGKIFHTILILAFLVVVVPHQVLVHAFLMQHFSVLFMPVLYICFGAVFDALIFVALYSWVVSKAPANATM